VSVGLAIVDAAEVHLPRPAALVSSLTSRLATDRVPTTSVIYSIERATSPHLLDFDAHFVTITRTHVLAILNYMTLVLLHILLT